MENLQNSSSNQFEATTVPSASIHVVIGAGPVGWSIAEQLAQAGRTVHLLTRSARGPLHQLIKKYSVDASDATALNGHIDAADARIEAVFHCAHGSKYNAKVWEEELPRTEQVVLEAAGRVGAVVVFPESLYAYSEPENTMFEDSPRDACGGKRGVRVELLNARQASATNTVSVVASDFFGPRVLTAFAGERMIKPILDGKRVMPTGSLNASHTFTYIPDFAAAMIKAAANRTLWNHIIHAPSVGPVTQKELISGYAATAGVSTPKITAIPAWLIRTMGLVSADMRDLGETAYQFEKPFVMDSQFSQEQLGMTPTPLDVALKATINWWRSEDAPK